MKMDWLLILGINQDEKKSFGLKTWIIFIIYLKNMQFAKGRESNK